MGVCTYMYVYEERGYACVCSGHYNNVGASVYVQCICHVSLSHSLSPSPTQLLCAYLKDDF